MNTFSMYSIHVFNICFFICFRINSKYSHQTEFLAEFMNDAIYSSMFLTYTDDGNKTLHEV